MHGGDLRAAILEEPLSIVGDETTDFVDQRRECCLDVSGDDEISAARTVAKDIEITRDEEFS